MYAYTRRPLTLFALMLAFAVPACSNSQEKSAQASQAREIYAGFHCGSQTPGGSIEWVTDALRLERAFAKLSSNFATKRTTAPDVDFSRRHVVVIYMGTQATAGYSLQLARDEFRTFRGTAEITLAWNKPQPGMMTAQVITSPCVVVTVPKRGYERFQVVDTGGTVRLSSQRPGK